ncbi:unnamed protein product, partial [Mesorhabditis belari]|uniref:Strictosidine synthase conserved region domain-containing protein n=1 Tax=Mesorhabditis belari TaxID=2138241 RepID=A0AAF3EUL8_9BILA
MLSTIFKLGIIGVFLSIIPVYFRYNDPGNVRCKAIDLGPLPELKGVLAVNDKLSNVEYVLKDQVEGPESIAAIGETLYTGLYDGRVVKIENGKIVKSIKLTKEKECGTYDTEPRCGRPLGIRRIGNVGESFYVVDAYRGIEIVDFKEGTHRLVFNASQPIAGKPARFLNDLDLLNSDELLITDTSATYGRRNFMFPIIEGLDDGRLFHLKVSTGETKLLVDRLAFANGVQLLPDQSAVLVAELGRGRIIKYHLNGAKKGKTEIWADRLPGLPDNIRLDSQNNLWVGLSLLRYNGAESLLDKLAPYPTLRQFVLDVTPAKWWLTLVPLTRPSYAMVLKMDLNGKILSTLQDPNGEKLGAISEVLETGNYLYFGSFDAPYIGRLKKM